MLDYAALNRRFREDQAEAAREDATAVFADMAGARGVDYSQRPSGWVLRLVRQSRRHRCAHWPREGSAVVLVAAHTGRMECRRCARETSRGLVGSPDEARCDLCREAVELERFAFQVGTLLLTGRCCAACRPTVYGGAA